MSMIAKFYYKHQNPYNIKVRYALMIPIYRLDLLITYAIGINWGCKLANFIEVCMFLLRFEIAKPDLFFHACD